MKPLNQYKVLTFDCYGTLIDWEAGIAEALQSLAVDLTGKPSSSPEELLAKFAQIESAQEHETPGLRYSELLALVYKRLAESLERNSTPEEARRFGASVPHWPAFEDSAKALAYLKQHFRLVVLSNVDQKSFAGSQQKLGVKFDAVYTAEDIGSYKPSLKNFEYLLLHLERDFGIARGDVLHVAQSLFHDHDPANRIGLDSAFIDRRHDRAGFGATKPPAAGVRYDFRFTSMAALADAHRLAEAAR